MACLLGIGAIATWDAASVALGVGWVLASTWGLAAVAAALDGRGLPVWSLPFVLWVPAASLARVVARAGAFAVMTVGLVVVCYVAAFGVAAGAVSSMSETATSIAVGGITVATLIGFAWFLLRANAARAHDRRLRRAWQRDGRTLDGLDVARRLAELETSAAAVQFLRTLRIERGMSRSPTEARVLHDLLRAVDKDVAASIETWCCLAFRRWVEESPGSLRRIRELASADPAVRDQLARVLEGFQATAVPVA